MVSLRSHLAGRLIASRTFQARLPPGGMLLLACLGLALHARPAGAGPIAARWLEAQTNLHSWTASVKQIRSFKTLAQPLEETGRVWFEAPNRFRWEIGTPAKTIALRRSDELLVIYPKLRRAERFPLGQGQAGPWKETLALLEAGFPRSQTELEARFKIVSETCTNGTCSIGLQPRAASARRMMPLVTVSFSRDDALLRATELHFADGSFMRNEFSEGVANPAIPAATFEPALGPDIEVVEPLAGAGRKNR